LYFGIGTLGKKIYAGLISPSTAITGFSFVIVTLLLTRIINISGLEFYLTGFALSLMSFGFLYRYRFAKLNKELDSQRTLSSLMGHGKWQTFWHVLLPQARVDVAGLAGISAFWAAGDFALSKILLQQESTLGLLMQSLLSRYQYDGASWIMLLMVLSGGGLFLLFGKLYYVAR